jgi:branched-chain amino acid transport system ATP-binding protein
MSDTSELMDKSLALSSMSSFFGSVVAVDAVNLKVGPGESVGVIGENGAGKSTLLRSIARLHRRTSGSIEYGGRKLANCTPDQVARLGITFVRDGGKAFEALTIQEHLLLASRLRRIRTGATGDPDAVLERFPVLSRLRSSTKAGYLSGGQRQALCLAMASASGATCLLLDEPSAGLAESTAEEIFAEIGQLSGDGMSLLIAEQDRRWLDGLTSRVIELEAGRVLDDTGTGRP